MSACDEGQDMARELDHALLVHRIPYRCVAYDEVKIGPSVIEVPFELLPGAKLKELQQRREDISRCMGVPDEIFIANSRSLSRHVVAQIPRKKRSLPDVCEYVCPRDPPYVQVALGVQLDGQPYQVELDYLPNLLIGGKSGSGKSTLLRSLVYQLTCCYPPEMLELVVIDGKGMADFVAYRDAGHIRSEGDFCDEPDQALELLEEIVERRLPERKRQFKEIVESRGEGKSIPDLRALGCWQEQTPPIRPLVVVLDELAEISMASGQARRLSELLTRFSQSARALGSHLIVATQRPSADVVKGVVKANFARLACRVESREDSRVILDHPGAEDLLDCGDLLFRSSSDGLVRLQGFDVP